MALKVLLLRRKLSDEFCVLVRKNEIFIAFAAVDVNHGAAGFFQPRRHFRIPDSGDETVELPQGACAVELVPLDKLKGKVAGSARTGGNAFA